MVYEGVIKGRFVELKSITLDDAQFSYDIQGDSAEIGREVSYGNCVEVIESEILAEDFAMDVLGLKKLRSVIYANNAKHLNNQKHAGAKPIKKVIRSGVESYYFETILSKDTPTRRKLAKIGDDFI